MALQLQIVLIKIRMFQYSMVRLKIVQLFIRKYMRWIWVHPSSFHGGKIKKLFCLRNWRKSAFSFLRNYVHNNWTQLAVPISLLGTLCPSLTNNDLNTNERQFIVVQTSIFFLRINLDNMYTNYLSEKKQNFFHVQVLAYVKTHTHTSNTKNFLMHWLR